MGIKLVRIDDRLIHGQVATTWIKNYGIEQVLIINDKAAKDPVQKSMVGLAAPPEVKVMIFGLDQFVNIMKKSEIKKTTMLLFTTSTDVLKIVESELVDIKEVNAGGMRFNETRKRLTKAISVTPEEDEAFRKIMDRGIKVNVQMVPKDTSVDYKTLIQ